MIAAGAASGKLTAKLGTRIPVTPERGYHITIEDSGVDAARSRINVDAKFVSSPMNMGLRVAGTAEFAGLDAPPNWKRADAAGETGAADVPRREADKVTRWAGNRPSLPDGLPVLGPAPDYDNAFFAFGNSHFGITGGPVMGKYIAEIVAGRKPGIDVTPFSPPRFGQ